MLAEGGLEAEFNDLAGTCVTRSGSSGRKLEHRARRIDLIRRTLRIGQEGGKPERGHPETRHGGTGTNGPVEGGTGTDKINPGGRGPPTPPATGRIRAATRVCDGRDRSPGSGDADPFRFRTRRSHPHAIQRRVGTRFPAAAPVRWAIRRDSRARYQGWCDDAAQPPEWSATNMLPGRPHSRQAWSSPIVWNNRVFSPRQRTTEPVAAFCPSTGATGGSWGP